MGIHRHSADAEEAGATVGKYPPETRRLPCWLPQPCRSHDDVYLCRCSVICSRIRNPAMRPFSCRALGCLLRRVARSEPEAADLLCHDDAHVRFGDCCHRNKPSLKSPCVLAESCTLCCMLLLFLS